MNETSTEEEIETMKKRFYFATQTGTLIYDDLELGVALQVIAELKRQGFYYCYSIWVS